MKKSFWNRRRRWWGVGIAVAIAASLLLGAQYFDTWHSDQYAYYNAGIQMYKAGDRICNKQQLADPLGNHCIDIESAQKLFGASMKAWDKQLNAPTPLEQFVLPGASHELAALAALHQGVLAIMNKKPEEAVKAFKLSIMIANQGPDTKMLRAIKKAAQYDLELLFKKNPSQAQGQGKGQPKPGNQPGKPEQGNRPKDQEPSDPAGKLPRTRI
jgi:hypothetical protein